MNNCDPVTVAFLGDSVTQGCFECYSDENGSIQTVFDIKSAYGARFKEMLNLLYPNVQINVINSGISGDSAIRALNRVERDVLRYCPDLTVVSFGLNDSTGGLENLDNYGCSLKKIIEKIKASGSEVIFLTQNYMNTKVSCHLKERHFRDLAERFSEVQNNGVLKKYFEKAKEICAETGAKVCDLYPTWEKMERAGVDITELLSNKLNHPIREYHYYIAIKLLETIME